MIIKDKNLFLQFYHGIPVSKFGRNHREKLSNRGSYSHSKNCHLYRQLLTCLTIERVDAEIIDEIDRLLKLLFKSTPAGKAATERGKRIERFNEKYSLKDDFYEMLKERYDIAEAFYKDELDESFDSGTLQEQSVSFNARCQGGGDY